MGGTSWEAPDIHDTTCPICAQKQTQCLWITRCGLWITLPVGWRNSLTGSVAFLADGSNRRVPQPL